MSENKKILDSSETNTPLPSANLKEQLQTAPVIIGWANPEYGDGQDKETEEPEQSFIITIDGFEDKAWFDGTLVPRDFDGKRMVRAGQLTVEEQARGSHVGEKLTRAFGAVAAQRGCEEIEVNFQHPASLKHFARVFGFERIEFGHQTEGAISSPYNPTFDEALEKVTDNRLRLGRRILSDGREIDSLYDTPDMHAWVDLKGLNTSGWELPAETDISVIEDRLANTA